METLRHDTNVHVTQSECQGLLHSIFTNDKHYMITRYDNFVLCSESGMALLFIFTPLQSGAQIPLSHSFFYKINVSFKKQEMDPP